MTGAAAAGTASGGQAGGGASTGADAAGAAEAATGGDYADLAQQIGSQSADQEQMRQQLQQLLRSRPWVGDAAQPDAGAVGEGEDPQGDDPQGDDDELDDLGDVDLSFLDDGEFMDDPAESARELAGVLDQAVAEHVKPLQQELESQRDAIADERDSREWQNLAYELPELADEGVAREVFSAAHKLAEAHGSPQLATKPWFVKVVFLAGKASEYAAEEEGEAPTAAHLEGGGGAAPAGANVSPMTQVFGGPDDVPLGARALPFHAG